MQGAVQELIHVDQDTTTISLTQDVQGLLDDNLRLSQEAPTKFGQAAWRLAGRIPAVVATQWSIECGAGIGTKEYAAYVRKKLMDGDFARLRVKGY